MYRSLHGRVRGQRATERVCLAGAGRRTIRWVTRILLFRNAPLSILELAAESRGRQSRLLAYATSKWHVDGGRRTPMTPFGASTVGYRGECHVE
jgi:hypothetical protein